MCHFRQQEDPACLGALLCKQKWRTLYLFSCLGSMHCNCWTLLPCVKSAVRLSRSLLELSGDSVLSSCHSHTCDNLLSVSSRLDASEHQVVKESLGDTLAILCSVNDCR